jgi:hypothetical protein|tara:strand:- start:879 stop:1190 length:312 start_codon:yes stop_codon:yes gene_type:complete
MIVRDVIKTLTKHYNPEDEIIIDWVDKEQMDYDCEMTDETWSDALDKVQRGDSLLSMDWIEHCVFSAQEEAEEDRKQMKADALRDEYRDDGFFADSGGFLGDR